MLFTHLWICWCQLDDALKEAVFEMKDNEKLSWLLIFISIVFGLGNLRGRNAQLIKRGSLDCSCRSDRPTVFPILSVFLFLPSLL